MREEDKLREGRVVHLCRGCRTLFSSCCLNHLAIDVGKHYSEHHPERVVEQ